jgi:hypothetical protein
MLKQTKTVVALMAGLSLVLLGSAAAQAADNWVGTWKLNLAKSKYSPGPAPKSNVAKYEAWDGGVKAVTDGVGADDKPTHTEFAAKFDGKDYPYKGSASFDTIVVKRIDDNTYEATVKSKGKVVVTSRNVVSKDGKTRTQTQTGTDAQGKAINNTVVYDRQ